MLLTLLDAQEIGSLGFVQRTMDLALEELGVTEDRLQRGTEFVAQKGQELGFYPI